MAGIAGEVSTIPDLRSPVLAVDSLQEAGGGAEAFGAASVCGGKLNCEEAFVDVTFASAKTWALPLLLPVVARGQDRRHAAGNGFPLAVSVQST